MKYKFIFLWMALCINFVLFANEREPLLFRSLDLNFIDYYTGDSIMHVNSCLDFKKKDCLNHVNITISDREGQHFIYCYYKDGLLIEKDDVVHGTKYRNLFEYTDSNKLSCLKEGASIFSYKYNTENSRDLFYNGEFQCREIISVMDDNKKRLISQSGKLANLKDSLFIEFEYNDSFQLLCYKFFSVRDDGTLSGGIVFDFNYSNNKINEIKQIYEKFEDDSHKSKLGNTINIEYNENGIISKVVNENHIRPEETYYILFSNYDTYGNWHESRKYRGQVLVEEIQRTFFYN